MGSTSVRSRVTRPPVLCSSLLVLRFAVNSTLFIRIARRLPSLSSALALNSVSARRFSRMMSLFASVRITGSAKLLTIQKSHSFSSACCSLESRRRSTSLARTSAVPACVANGISRSRSASVSVSSLLRMTTPTAGTSRPCQVARPNSPESLRSGTTAKLEISMSSSNPSTSSPRCAARTSSTRCGTPSRNVLTSGLSVWLSEISIDSTMASGTLRPTVPRSAPRAGSYSATIARR